MSGQPFGQTKLAEVPSGNPYHKIDDFFFRRLEPYPVKPEKDIHGKEGNALVSVHVAVISRDAVSIRRGEPDDSCLSIIGKLITRPGEGRLDRALVADSTSPAVLPELVRVNRVENSPRDPERLAQRLLCQLSEGVAILARSSLVNFHGIGERRIIRSEEYAGIGFHGEDLIAGLELEARGHFLRDGGADGSSRLTHL